MAFFNEFPHTRTYDNDLGWLIKIVKELEVNLQNFIKLNTVKYADPIQWNIATQYEANTVVIDALTGVAYISTQPVPSGVNINNTDYWTPVFTLDLVNLNKNITLRNDGDNHNATFASVIGDWVIVGGQLYKVIQDISLYTAYVVGYNIQVYSVELFVKDYLNQVLNLIGDLDDLSTPDKTSVVNAINSILSTIIGDLDDLNTSDKTSVVNAINSVLTDINTTIGDLDDLNTSDKTSVVNAINSVISDIGVNTIRQFPDVSAMVNADLDSGCVMTEGYHSANDGGGAFYIIDSTSGTGYENITLNNGNYAHLIVTEPVNIKTLGAYGDDTNDDSAFLQYAVDHYLSVFIPEGTYLISNAVSISNDSVKITGCGVNTVLHGENILVIENNGEKLTLIENIKFYNDDNAAAGNAIEMATTNGVAVNVTVRNCYFYYCYNAIYLNEEADNITIDGCYFYRNILHSLYSANTITHVGLYITNSHFQACRDGATEIELYKPINVNIDNCIFQEAIRTNTKHIVLHSGRLARITNTYHEILGSGATTNQAIIFDSFNDALVDNIEISGNVGGVISYSISSLITILVSHRITVNNVHYTTNAVDYLISVGGTNLHLKSNWNNDTIAVCHPDFRREFEYFRDVDGKLRSLLNPQVMKVVNITGGGSVTTSMAQEAPGFFTNAVYLVTVTDPINDRAGVFVTYKSSVYTLNAIANFTVTVNGTGTQITVTNTGAGDKNDIAISIINLTSKA